MAEKRFTRFCQQAGVIRSCELTYMTVSFQLPDAVSFYKGNLKVFNHNFPPVLPGGFPVTGIGECDFHVTVRHGRRDFHCSAAGCHIGSFVPLCSVYPNFSTE